MTGHYCVTGHVCFRVPMWLTNDLSKDISCDALMYYKLCRFIKLPTHCPEYKRTIITQILLPFIKTRTRQISLCRVRDTIRRRQIKQNTTYTSNEVKVGYKNIKLIRQNYFIYLILRSRVHEFVTCYLRQESTQNTLLFSHF